MNDNVYGKFDGKSDRAARVSVAQLYGAVAALVDGSENRRLFDVPAGETLERFRDDLGARLVEALRAQGVEVRFSAEDRVQAARGAIAKFEREVSDFGVEVPGTALRLVEDLKLALGGEV